MNLLSNLSNKLNGAFNKRNRKRILFLLFLLLFNIISLYVYPPQKANATVTEAFVRLDRLSTGAAITGTACEKTSTVGTETGVIIVFPNNSWTISGTAANWTVTTTNLPTDPVGGGAASAWPGIGTATVVNGLSVRFPSTDLTASTFYCFNFAGASSTIGSAGNNQTGILQTQGGSPFVDQTAWATSIVASNADQIAVSASVSATMTFSLSVNSLNLGTLSTSATASQSAVHTVSTNAQNGYTSWIKGTNADGLHSTTANAGISSPSTYPTITDLSSTPGYGLDVTNVSGTQSIAAGYWTSNSANQVGHIDTTYDQTASAAVPVSSNQVSIDVKARISATQAAASDYADTLTVTAAGNF